MKHANLIAGGTVMAAGYGLACVSGGVAAEGFVSLTGMWLFAPTGPFVALAAAGLGTATELAVKSRNWVRAGVYALLCAGAGTVDWYSGSLAFEAKADARAQAAADRQIAFDTSSQTVVQIDARITTLETHQTAMLAALDPKLEGEALEDAVTAAQAVLFTEGLYPERPDGEFGKLTEKAIRDYAATIREDLPDLREDRTEHAAIIAAGAPVEEAAHLDPHLMAAAVTILAIVLSFVGSVIAFGLRREPLPEETLAAREANLKAEQQHAAAERAAELSLLQAMADRLRSENDGLEEWIALERQQASVN